MAVRAGDGLGAADGAGTAALLAQAERVDLHMRGTAEHHGLQVHRRAGQRVAAGLGAGNRPLAAATERPAEELAEDIAHVAHAETAAETASVRVVRVDPGVVHPPLLGVGQHLVGVVDLFVLLLEFRAGKVGMVLAAHLAIGLLDVVIAGRSVHAQYFVVVCHWFVPSCWMFASHCAIRLGQECVAGPSWARNAVRYRATARTAAMVVA